MNSANTNKDNIKNSLSGVFAPIVTPFVNEKISYLKLKKNIQMYNNTELKGYMPLGSNGEYLGLTEVESLKVLNTVVDNKAADKKLIVGAGRESAKVTIQFIKKVSKIGADFACVIPPHYYARKMNDEALIYYYSAVAEQSLIPIIIYNAPGYAAEVLISQKAISLLSQHLNIVAMKNSSNLDTKTYANGIPSKSDFYFIGGNIKNFYEGLKAGAVGGVLSMACYLPKLCCELYKLYRTGNDKRAKEMHEYLCDLSDRVVGKYGVAGVKAAMDIIGFYGGVPRNPLIPLNNEEKLKLKENLERSIDAII
jgi:4-hydroxy-2-oxoglutarate aldolase